jgi:alcohol dehydrogenase
MSLLASTMNTADLQSWEAELGRYRLIYGAGRVDRLGRLAREIGGSRVLVVTDPGIREAGHVAPALESLKQAGIETRVFEEVDENPTAQHVDEGVSVAREHGADCLVGLGGGSAMDCAKGVNFVLTNGGRIDDYWGTGKATKAMLPSIGIPTTAGSGAEAQSYALICQDGTGIKMACGDKKAMFQRVILDPQLAASVPPDVAAVSGVDAVSHAVESYVTTRRNPVSQMLAREAWRLLETNLPAILTGTEDVGAWGKMLLGAHLAGAAIEQSMLGAAHACANPLTARFPIPHGIAVGLMLPHVIRLNATHVGPLYEELRLAVDPAAPPALLEDRIHELRAIAGLPESLRDYQIPRSCLSELAAEAEGQWTAGFNPRPVTRLELLELYEAAYV